jgi:hypothetical protein
VGDWIEYAFDGPKRVKQVRLVFDSDLNRKESAMPANYPLHSPPVSVPSSLVRTFRIETLGENGAWQLAVREPNNYQRLVRLQVDITTRAVRFIPESTWGAETVHCFSFEVSD